MLVLLFTCGYSVQVVYNLSFFILILLFIAGRQDYLFHGYSIFHKITHFLVILQYTVQVVEKPTSFMVILQCTSGRQTCMFPGYLFCKVQVLDKPAYFSNILAGCEAHG
jgi:hypothetical protein